MAFDFSKFNPNLFTTKVKEENKDSIESNIKDEPISYQRYGFKQAGNMNGSIEGLKICLNRVFQEHLADVRRNDAKQEELRKPFREKLQELITAKESVKMQIKTIEDDIIPSRKKKIEQIKEDISEIRKHPEQYTGNQIGKAGYYIGISILIFLTLYLFIFYSSASYSALFKEFRISDAQNTNSILTKSIFDAKAITNALRDGITELILILTIPFVFLGLGYLIHKFQEAKNVAKYFKIASLLIITFVFDTILAFEITKKIYDLNAGNTFKDLPDYTLKLAFTEVNFWLIIFAGFIVYIIWGFVFDFVMDAYTKLDIVKVHVRAKHEQIEQIEKDIIKDESTVHELKMASDKSSSEINKIKEIINGTIVSPKEVKESLTQFMVGWYNWLSHGREYNRSDHNKTYEEFLLQNVIVIETVINPN